MFEHCSLCFRVRMMAALKRLHLQETVVLDDDFDTMIGLFGRRVIRIFVNDCGQAMLENWIWSPTSTHRRVHLDRTNGAKSLPRPTEWSPKPGR